MSRFRELARKEQLTETNNGSRILVRDRPIKSKLEATGVREAEDKHSK
jgi:hypothetical protein